MICQEIIDNDVLPLSSGFYRAYYHIFIALCYCLYNFTCMTGTMVSKKAFWDVNFAALDFEKSSLFIMQKVFNYGSWNDQVAIMRLYGLERIKKEIIDASYLRQPVLSFLCNPLAELISQSMFNSADRFVV